MSALAKLQTMDRAYTDMIASASKFDGSYEAARNRFNDIRDSDEPQSEAWADEADFRYDMARDDAMMGAGR